MTLLALELVAVLGLVAAIRRARGRFHAEWRARCVPVEDPI
jgi:hypothetical protein